MKLLNKFILASFLRPFFRSLAVSLFILIVQFLAAYKSDLIGKGLETFVIVKIFFFAAISLLVLALPVAVLLSSLFAMGNFGENYELAAMRSAGMSISKILKPMVFGTLVVTFFSTALSSYIVPWANLKLYSILYDVGQMKPVFRLEPGHFNSAIDDYVIRITHKDVSTEMLYGVSIYDHTNHDKLVEPIRIYNEGTPSEFWVIQDSNSRNNRFVFADSGYMRVDPYGKYMHMMLYSGASYESKVETNQKKRKNVERFVQIKFDSLYYSFDMKGFSMERTEEKAFSQHQYMLNLTDLVVAMDSIRDVQEDLSSMLEKALGVETKLDSAFMKVDTLTYAVPPESIILVFPKAKRKSIVEDAIHRMTKSRQLTAKAIELFDKEELHIRERGIEFHSRLALPMACLVFLFVGAPLGTIIRRGGAGVPIIVSIVMYVFFSVLRIQGKKMATEGVLEPWLGAWLPVLVILPIALFLSFESLSPVGLLSSDTLWRLARWIVKWLILTNPLYWLYRIPPVGRAMEFVAMPVIRLFRGREEKRTFRVRR